MCDIYFGTVENVKDTEKICRIQVSIPGYTNEIPVEFLPWYFPFYGINYLPIVGDTVPILIFNDNITQGFYNNKIDLTSNGLDGTEYENYVELYKRLGVEIIYKESEGWLILNQKSKVQINKEQIDIISNRINHGSGKEPMLLGTKTFDILTRLVDAILVETHTTPNGPSGVPINASTYQKIKSDLEKIKSKNSFLE